MWNWDLHWGDGYSWKSGRTGCTASAGKTVFEVDRWRRNRICEIVCFRVRRSRFPNYYNSVQYYFQSFVSSGEQRYLAGMTASHYYSGWATGSGSCFRSGSGGSGRARSRAWGRGCEAGGSWRVCSSCSFAWTSVCNFAGRRRGSCMVAHLCGYANDHRSCATSWSSSDSRGNRIWVSSDIAVSLDFWTWRFGIAGSRECAGLIAFGLSLFFGWDWLGSREWPRSHCIWLVFDWEYFGHQFGRGCIRGSSRRARPTADYPCYSSACQSDRHSTMTFGPSMSGCSAFLICLPAGTMFGISWRRSSILFESIEYPSLFFSLFGHSSFHEECSCLVFDINRGFDCRFLRSFGRLECRQRTFSGNSFGLSVCSFLAWHLDLRIVQILPPEEAPVQLNQLPACQYSFSKANQLVPGRAPKSLFGFAIPAFFDGSCWE